jgi:uncharacterized protein with GYD domain
MSRFSLQISFTSSAWHALMENPWDPLATIRDPIESLGGKLQHAFFTEEPYHLLAITEVPDHVSRADLAIAFYAGGAVAQVHTSQLLTASEAHEARRQSGGGPHHPAPHLRAFLTSAS